MDCSDRQPFISERGCREQLASGPTDRAVDALAADALAASAPATASEATAAPTTMPRPGRFGWLRPIVFRPIRWATVSIAGSLELLERKRKGSSWAIATE